MIRNSTPDLLLKYSYNELSESEKMMVEAALVSDSELYEEYEEIVAAKQLLDHLAIEPRKHVMRNIMAYSAAYAAVPSSIGAVDTLLN